MERFSVFDADNHQDDRDFLQVSAYFPLFKSSRLHQEVSFEFSNNLSRETPSQWLNEVKSPSKYVPLIFHNN
jgi:hypothetical protein